MTRPPSMAQCLHCKAFNQLEGEEISDTCWKCQGELPPIEKLLEKAEPSHTVREIPPRAPRPTPETMAAAKKHGLVFDDRNWVPDISADSVHPSASRKGMGEPVPLAYSAPKLEKLSLEERLLEHAANWHMVRARLQILEKQYEETTVEQASNLRARHDLLDAFYRFCVTLMKG
jgi:hypothetical protein